MRIFLLFLALPSLLLANLSIEEKVGQLLMVHFHGEECNADALRLIREAHVGAFIYYNWSNGLQSPTQIKSLSNQLQNAAKIPLIIAIDQEGGRVSRLKEGFTLFPSNREVGKTGDLEAAEEQAFIIGQELKAVGINMNLAPVVDIDSNPQNPVIGDRSFGSDPETVVAFGKKAAQGYQRAHIAYVLKHFPGHGDVSVDSHRDLPILNKSLDELEQMELAPFAAIPAPAIMTAHILIPSIDPNHPATTSKTILQDLLRKKMGFQGVIMSDSLVMAGILKQYPSIEEAAIAAVQAGCDMLILGGKQLLNTDEKVELTVDDIIRIHRALVDAAKSGKIAIDPAYKRVMQLKGNDELSKRT